MLLALIMKYSYSMVIIAEKCLLAILYICLYFYLIGELELRDIDPFETKLFSFMLFCLILSILSIFFIM